MFSFERRLDILKVESDFLCVWDWSGPVDLWVCIFPAVGTLELSGKQDVVKGQVTGPQVSTCSRSAAVYCRHCSASAATLTLLHWGGGQETGAWVWTSKCVWNCCFVQLLLVQNKFSDMFSLLFTKECWNMSFRCRLLSHHEKIRFDHRSIEKNLYWMQRWRLFKPGESLTWCLTVF